MKRILILAAGLLPGMLTGVVQAQTESMLYEFNGPTFPSSGCDGSGNLQPRAGLLFYHNHLYGTTPSGGTGEKGVPDTRDGTAFQLSLPKPDKTEGARKNIHSFFFPGDGTYPCAGLLQAFDGCCATAFFGTTPYGGARGWGSVYEVKPPPAGQKQWTETVIYSFQDGGDGAQPFDGLSLGFGTFVGSLFGATRQGGNAFDDGTIFMLTPPAQGQTQWTFTTIYRFNGVAHPNGGLFVDTGSGAVFGTTPDGGFYGGGTAFKLTPPGTGQTAWSFTTIWDFGGPQAPAAHPNGGLIGTPRALYGTTQNGGIGGTAGCCGVVFALTQTTPNTNDYTMTAIHQFSGGSDGASPVAGLFEDFRDRPGTMWGTTSMGGSADHGTVFKVVPTWLYSVWYRFQGAPNDGATPMSALAADRDGNLYGTTNAGGFADLGTVFKLTP